MAPGSLISSVKSLCEAQRQEAVYSTVTRAIVWAFSAGLRYYYHEKDQHFFLLPFCLFVSLLALDFSAFHFDTLTLRLFSQTDIIRS